MKRIIAIFMCMVLLIGVCSCDTNKEIEEENGNGTYVYVTPAGSKFHLSMSCAGNRAKQVSYNKIKRYYTPCKKCTR